MKRRLFAGILSLVLVLLLAGCGCSHEWYVATCTSPKTCHLCGITEGEALGHSWTDADCLTAKTCTVCKDTDGDPLGHTWQDATCDAPKTCSTCSVTEGEALEHVWLEATTEDPMTCSACKLTEGERLITDPRFTTLSTKELYGTWTSDVHISRDALGLEAGFENGIDCVLILEFTKTGELLIRMELKDKDAFMAELKVAYIDAFYEAMRQEGLSKSETDQLVKDAYDMTVEELIDDELKYIDLSALFQMFKLEGCYYVEHGEIYISESWDEAFDSSGYALKNGVLTIEELTHPETEEVLEWTLSE